MPIYPWLYKGKTAYDMVSKKMNVLASLGVPYSENDIASAEMMAQQQAEKIYHELAKGGVESKMMDKEIIALIAYLQRLGIDAGHGEDDEVASTK